MRVLSFSRENVGEGARVVRGGGVIVYPTDTVYGVGGDPFSRRVVERVARLKGRGVKPFPVLVCGVEEAEAVAEVRGRVRELLETVWPGAVTVALPARVEVPAAMGDRYVGLRMPADETLLELIREVGGYLIGTSANASGKPPATTVGEAMAYFGEGVDLYYDGGARGGTPSTVVKVINSRRLVVVRSGAAVEEVAARARGLGFEVIRP